MTLGGRGSSERCDAYFCPSQMPASLGSRRLKAHLVRQGANGSPLKGVRLGSGCLAPWTGVQSIGSHARVQHCKRASCGAPLRRGASDIRFAFAFQCVQGHLGTVSHGGRDPHLHSVSVWVFDKRPYQCEYVCCAISISLRCAGLVLLLCVQLCIHVQMLVS